MRKEPAARPEAVPFQRGKRPARPSPSAEIRLDWVTPETAKAFSFASTNAYRLASGPGAWLERFGNDVLFSYLNERSLEAVLKELDVRAADYGFPIQRIFGKHLPTHAAERGAPARLRGDELASLQTEVLEAGVRFGLDFAGGYSAGLFIDQRANRGRLRAEKPRRVLNTFAYTCSFSVVAALAGAETVSIDLSRRSLARGEQNFARNGLDPKAGHRFIADDVLDVLPRLARRGETFDAIVLDPPTFSRNRSGAAFQVQRDFDRLVLLALEVAAPGAKILLSVNHSEMRVADLERAARSALRLHRRAGRFRPADPLPDFPPGHGARALWLEL
jgi:23S rRNA (cytosine1962-C5)-methyltransferase